jgi:ATP-dependent exoDNAse (exonuclease V) beta subunit
MKATETLKATLSPEQREVVETWGVGLAVVAGAGCGKTTTLTLKCAELLKRNPKAQFAAVSFTEKSAADLRLKLSSRLSELGLVDPSYPLKGHWVTTIHGLCAMILRENPKEAGLDGEESMLSEPEAQALWGRAVETLWSDSLPEGLARDLDLLLERETQDSLTEQLLARVRDLEAYGLTDRLAVNPSTEERALLSVSRAVVERYQKLKRRRGALDFADLERGAALVLRNPELRALYQKRFDLVLVDEFQDTNPLQGELLWAFARPDQSNLCVVGDPKQSIYRFRDADVSVFDEYCAKLPGPRGAPLVLSKNFRSRPQIIEAVNAVCAPIFEKAQLRYDPLISGRPPSETEQDVIRIKVQEPRELASWLKERQALGDSLNDYCLLMRSIRGRGRKWLQALTQEQVPLAVASGGLFWEDPRVRELVAFLKSWTNPTQVLSMAIFLRAPWVGVRDEEIDQWIAKDATLQESFYASQHPLAQALLGYRSNRDVRVGELLLALCISRRIEEELGPALLGLWHRAEDLSSRGNDFHAIVREFARSVEHGRRERDVPPPRGQGTLSVLTIHGSKGLEFPKVILVDFPEKPSPMREYPLLYWDRQKGARLAPRTVNGERDSDDPVELEWREHEKRLVLAETKRLFYVALTRAQEQLIWIEEHPPLQSEPPEETGVASKKAKSSAAREKDPEAALNQDHWRGWMDWGVGVWLQEVDLRGKAQVTDITPSNQEEGAEASHAALCNESSRLDITVARSRHSVTEWSHLLRCPLAYSWKVVDRKLPDFSSAHPEGELPHSARQGSGWEDPVREPGFSQRELGTRVHACLETRDEAGLQQIEDEVGSERFQAHAVIEWARMAPEMEPSNSASGRAVWSELSFELPVESEVLVGAMDRLVFDPENQKYQILDFKVTRRLKSQEELLRDYQTQMKLYAWALGQLEPESRSRMSARLVAFSDQAVTDVLVPLPARYEDLDAEVKSWALEAAQLISGVKEAKPRSGLACQHCDYRQSCQFSAYRSE